MKSEVYSWRVSSAVKAQLESEARRRKLSMAALLDQLVREGLSRRKLSQVDDEEEQSRLHAEAEKAIGTFAGDPRLSESARELIRGRLRRKHDRSRAN